MWQEQSQALPEVKKDRKLPSPNQQRCLLTIVNGKLLWDTISPHLSLFLSPGYYHFGLIKK
jgi:hypothetical protein